MAKYSGEKVNISFTTLRDFSNNKEYIYNNILWAYLYTLFSICS